MNNTDIAPLLEDLYDIGYTEGLTQRQLCDLAKEEAISAIMACIAKAGPTISDEAILSLAHRKATQYSHSSGNQYEHMYTFSDMNMLDFVRVVVACNSAIAPI